MNSNSVYRKTTFVTAEKERITLGGWVNKNANAREAVEDILKQNGGRMIREFDEKFGVFYVKEIRLLRDGNEIILKKVQLYDQNGNMFFQIGEGNAKAWGNFDTIKACHFTHAMVKDDSDLPETNLPNPNIFRSGGGANHADDASKSDIEKVKEVSVTLSVNLTSGEMFTLDGTLVANQTELNDIAKQELEKLGLPPIPVPAIPTFERFVGEALHKVLPDVVYRNFEQQMQQEANTFDGIPVSISIILNMVATRFDAVERYQLSVSAAKTSDNDSEPYMKNTKTSSFFVDLPIVEIRGDVNCQPEISDYNQIPPTRHSSDSTILPQETPIKPVATPKEHKEEESMIIRMIMNPTERRLWGRLYGFPDEDQKPFENDDVPQQTSRQTPQRVFGMDNPKCKQMPVAGATEESGQKKVDGKDAEGAKPKKKEKTKKERKNETALDKKERGDTHSTEGKKPEEVQGKKKRNVTDKVNDERERLLQKTKQDRKQKDANEKERKDAEKDDGKGTGGKTKIPKNQRENKKPLERKALEPKNLADELRKERNRLGKTNKPDKLNLRKTPENNTQKPKIKPYDELNKKIGEEKPAPKNVAKDKLMDKLRKEDEALEKEKTGKRKKPLQPQKQSPLDKIKLGTEEKKAEEKKKKEKTAEKPKLVEKKNYGTKKASTHRQPNDAARKYIDELKMPKEKTVRVKKVDTATLECFSGSQSIKPTSMAGRIKLRKTLLVRHSLEKTKKLPKDANEPGTYRKTRNARPKEKREKQETQLCAASPFSSLRQRKASPFVLSWTNAGRKRRKKKEKR